MDSERNGKIRKVNGMEQMDSYTDSEKTSMVLSSARKAINYSYPGIKFWSLLVVFSLSIVWLMTKYVSPQLHTYRYILTAGIMVFLLVEIYISERWRRKIQRYSFNMPLKKWIWLRIVEFDNEAKIIQKDWFWRYGSVAFYLLIFCLIYIITVGFSLKVLLFQLAVGLIILFIGSHIANRIQMKHIRETLRQLQELHDQLEDPKDSKENWLNPELR